MDGVLFDSEPLHLSALNAIFANDVVTVSEADNLEFLGWPVEEVVREIVARHGLAKPLDAYMDRYDKAITQAFREQLVAAPAVHQLLQALRSRSVRIGLASSSRLAWIEAALDALELRQYFDALVSADDVARTKPSPDVYLLACAKLGVDPTQAIAVEDSPAGILAAKRAGMRVYAVRTPFTKSLPLDGADGVFASLADLAVEDFT